MNNNLYNSKASDIIQLSLTVGFLEYIDLNISTWNQFCISQERAVIKRNQGLQIDIYIYQKSQNNSLFLYPNGYTHDVYVFFCLFDYIDLYIDRHFTFSATIHFYCEVLRIEQCNSIKTLASK